MARHGSTHAAAGRLTACRCMLHFWHATACKHTLEMMLIMHHCSGVVLLMRRSASWDPGGLTDLQQDTQHAGYLSSAASLALKPMGLAPAAALEESPPTRFRPLITAWKLPRPSRAPKLDEGADAVGCSQRRE